MGFRWMLLVSGALLPWLGGCQTERSAKAEIVTQIQSARPAAERVVLATAPGAAPSVAGVAPSVAADIDPIDESAEYCRQVERQAIDTNSTLPKKLDADTKATRVAAYGCDVILEYAMLDLRVSDVAINGLRQVRSEVLQKLCADRGARGVMDHGGSFTNVYRDDRSDLIDQFTITAEDCSTRGLVDSATRVNL